jgi:hypothetical protein
MRGAFLPAMKNFDGYETALAMVRAMQIVPQRTACAIAWSDVLREMHGTLDHLPCVERHSRFLHEATAKCRERWRVSISYRGRIVH